MKLFRALLTLLLFSFNSYCFCQQQVDTTWAFKLIDSGSYSEKNTFTLPDGSILFGTTISKKGTSIGSELIVILSMMFFNKADAAMKAKYDIMNDSDKVICHYFALGQTRELERPIGLNGNFKIVSLSKRKATLDVDITVTTKNYGTWIFRGRREYLLSKSKLNIKQEIRRLTTGNKSILRNCGLTEIFSTGLTQFNFGQVRPFLNRLQLQSKLTASLHSF